MRIVIFECTICISKLLFIFSKKETAFKINKFHKCAYAIFISPNETCIYFFETCVFKILMHYMKPGTARSKNYLG